AEDAAAAGGQGGALGKWGGRPELIALVGVDQAWCFPIPQPPRARYFSPTSMGSSSNGVAIVSFHRLRNPNSEITPTISTICSSVQCLRNSANMSSVTALGTDAAATAKSSVARSAAL